MIKPNKNIIKYLDAREIGYVDKSIGIEKFQQDIKERYGLNKILRFDLGENSDGPPSKVLEELESANNSKIISEYPDSNYFKLKRELVSYYGNYGINIENISIGSGSCEIIKNINKCWLDKGDRAIFPIPSFYFIENSILENGATPIHIQLRKEESFQWTENVTNELNIVSNYIKPKIIWLVSPNNPTGAVIPKNSIIRIIENNQNSIVVVDEAYGEYVDENAIDLIGKFENLLVLRTFSKAYGMAGLRLGYCLGPKELIKILEEVRLEFPITSIAERLGTVALRDNDHLENTRKSLIHRKKLLLDSIEKINNIEYIPSKTNILLIRLKDSTNLYRELLRKGILTAKMGRDMKDYVRITIKNEKDNEILINNLIKIY